MAIANQRFVPIVSFENSDITIRDVLDSFAPDFKLACANLEMIHR